MHTFQVPPPNNNSYSSSNNNDSRVKIGLIRPLDCFDQEKKPELTCSSEWLFYHGFESHNRPAFIHFFLSSVSVMTSLIRKLKIPNFQDSNSKSEENLNNSQKSPHWPNFKETVLVLVSSFGEFYTCTMVSRRNPNLQKIACFQGAKNIKSPSISMVKTCAALVIS